LYKLVIIRPKFTDIKTAFNNCVVFGLSGEQMQVVIKVTVYL